MRKMVLHGLALWLFMLLAACSRGPGPELVEQQLQLRLDTHFQQDLFTIYSFSRTGSAPFHNIETGISGVYVYYDAQLQFQQDYSLTDWKGLNLGTMAFAIGATEAGIEGFVTGGNARGDLLRVHGRGAYREDSEGEWLALESHDKPPSARPKDAGPARHGRGAESVLADARILLVPNADAELSSHDKVIAAELGAAVNRIDLRLARLDGKMTLGTGPQPGTYHAFGVALSRYANSQGVAMYSSESVGSVENASRLQAGRLDFALVQSDVAQLMYQGVMGQGLFPSVHLRAVASLWPEAVHLLALEGSGIKSLADLKRRRVAVGKRGSGSRINSVLIALTAVIAEEDLPIPREIDLSKAIAQMERGDIDAIFLTEAVPSPAIQALAARRDDLRFIPLPASVLQRLSDQHFAYYPITVAARSYPGQSEPFTTLGVTAALMTREQVADERVEAMLNLLLGGGDELARDYYRAAFISRETMRLGLEVPLHPAAERFYQRYDARAETADSD